MKNKHAYLIMAHQKMENLKELIISLDNEYNDIFVHIDKKYKGDINLKVEKAQLFFIDRMKINWGGFSQIKCEVNLLKEAINNGPYIYYHLLTGVSYPIKSNEYIYKFFNDNFGYEFVGFDNSSDYSERVKFVYLFNELGKPDHVWKKVLTSIRKIWLFLQKKMNIDNFKKYKLVCKKGFVYWSITDEFAKYVVSKEKLIYSIMKNSLCGDEIFIQTLLYNSEFKDKIYNINNEFLGALRICPWGSSEIGERKNFCFEENDYKFLLESKYLYALKFDSIEGLKCLNKIKEGIYK